jgi:hypothetical protein
MLDGSYNVLLKVPPTRGLQEVLVVGFLTSFMECPKGLTLGNTFSGRRKRTNSWTSQYEGWKQ